MRVRAYVLVLVVKTSDPSSFRSPVSLSQKNMKAWLTSHEEYENWRRAASGVRKRQDLAVMCPSMKKNARKILLLLHPDK